MAKDRGKDDRERKELERIGARYTLIGTWIGVIGIYVLTILRDPNSGSGNAYLQGMGFGLFFLLVASLYDGYVQKQYQRDLASASEDEREVFKPLETDD